LFCEVGAIDGNDAFKLADAGADHGIFAIEAD
jgi:hypothetical protein